jgi:ribose transport system substrate-binding protein
MLKQVLTVAAAAAVLATAACSSSSGGSSSSSSTASAAGSASSGGGSSAVAAAQKAVDAAKAIPATSDLGATIDVSKLKGKTIYSIPIDSKAEFYSVGEAAMKAVAAKAGINYVTFPADGSQTSFQTGIQQAINAKAGAILLNGPLASTLGPQIDAAKAAGIPVIPLHLSDKDGPGTPGLNYEAFAPFNEAAKLFTDYSIVTLKGQAVHALVIQSSETGPAAGMIKTIADTLSSDGPSGSTSTVINVPVAQWSTGIQSQVQSALLKDPKINAVLPIYDSMALYAGPGIKQAQGSRDIKIYTFNGTPAIMKLIKDGSVATDIAENPDWVSYVNLDVAFRAMLAATPIKGESGPLRLIDASNVDETGNPPASGKGFGDTYAAAYLKLWGMS